MKKWRATLTFRKNETPEHSVYGGINVPGQFNGELIALCGTGDSSESNANLIAAAPELLEAAKKGLMYINGVEKNPDDYTVEVLSLLGKAIAKAEGQS